MNKSKQEIFKNGSVTYYTASLFFPKKIKEEIFTLYAFVRVADDFVDAIPQQKKEFLSFKAQTLAHLSGTPTDNDIIRDFVILAKKRNFSHEWIVAFLNSMEMDLHHISYPKFADLEVYMYGSAEVIGLFIAQILELPTTAHPSARLLGKAMQLINFIRDIQEDITLKRTYLPQEDLKKFGVITLLPTDENVSTLIKFEISRWKKIQKEAEKGFVYISQRSLLPIKTASDMYKWTAEIIEKDPLIVFEKKVKPRPARVIMTYVKNMCGV